MQRRIIVPAAATLLLAALASNGGPTETIALTTASPARNEFAPPCPVKADQRGVHRPQGTRCDIGAFERS